MMAGPSVYLPANASGLVSLPPNSMFDMLSETFQAYNEATSNDTCWEASRRKVAELEDQWHANGLSGRSSVLIMSQLRSQICWETMVPDQFIRFYRFMFHICKEPRKKHMQAEVALDIWRLVLAGRFRLLDIWCEFVQSKGSALRVINEDQWRQILDFSRTVHEDLSNFDQNGAWVCLLDEFVEYMRHKKSAAARSQFMDCDALTSDSQELSTSATRVSPRCGSKRRSPDIDIVAEQLSAMPLSSASSGQLHYPLPLKKHCGEAALYQPQVLAPQPLAGSSHIFEMPQDLMHNLPAVQTSTRRVVRTRRSGVSELVNSIVSDALGFPAL